MRTIGICLLVSVIGVGCSRSHQEVGPLATPAPGPTPGNAPAAPGNLSGVTASSMCSSDAECPGGKLCRLPDGACIVPYPAGRLVASANSAGTASVCEMGNVYFDFDSADLTPGAKGMLDTDLGCIKAQKYPSVAIEGHADARGDSHYNIDLSRRRAEAARDYLVQQGLDIPVTVRAMGAAERGGVPLDRNEQDYTWHRRVQLLIK